MTRFRGCGVQPQQEKVTKQKLVLGSRQTLTKLREESLFWANGFPKIRLHDHHSRGHGNRQAWCLRHRHRTRANCEWHGFFVTSKPIPIDTPAPTRATPPNLSQTVPPTGDQDFKHMGHFHSNHHVGQSEFHIYLQIKLLRRSGFSSSAKHAV